MEELLRCDCGYLARGADEDELVADARAHARVHRMEIPDRL
ncbi:MAG: DUF1059 domain-containing protein, partial [Acidimicrobiia bacterium]|nr:DUF1059 domain-containing protein [Acidimicrobiia bacterium]